MWGRPMKSELKTKKHLLLVDDEPSVLMMLSMLFEKDYQVETAQDGSQAIQYIQRRLPDLIVTDIYMPRLDGLNFLKILRSDPDTKHIPVIICTGKPQDDTLRKCFELGAVDHIVKPFSPQEILIRVSARLASAQEAQLGASLAMKKRTEELEQIIHLLREELQEDQFLLKELIETTDTEQSTLGSVLHDNICQSLAAVKFFVEEALCEQSQGNKIRRILQNTIAQTRTIAYGLDPLPLKNGGFAPVLMHLARLSEHLFQINCSCEFPDNELRLDEDITPHVYRLTQEVIRLFKFQHRAQNVVLSFSDDENHIQLVAKNDGMVSATTHPKNRTSLHLLQTRARIIGASMQIKQGEPFGHQITFWIPKRRKLPNRLPNVQQLS
jgi:CheY-like chemotaxis protein